MKFILMDVEGTTTSIDFVHDVLFPYSQKKMSWYLEHFPQECLQEKQNVEAELGATLSQSELSQQLIQWIQADKKHPALKSIQGKIWKLGYEAGEIKGDLYPEVASSFKKWVAAGYKLGIYSSGSVLAQKLLFKYSVQGDLTQYLSAHFDTGIGHKRETTSYQNISAELQLAASEILFLSDISQECHAAINAGMKSIQLIRDTKAIPDSTLQRVKDFEEIKI